MEEITPAARTILVRYNPVIVDAKNLVRQISARDISKITSKLSKLVVIPVHYTGEDLAEVAEILGISTDEVIRRHTENEYQVAFSGFSPGIC